MSDEQRKDDETEVEVHGKRMFGNDEPAGETDAEADDDDVDAHVMRKDVMRKD